MLETYLEGGRYHSLSELFELLDAFLHGSFFSKHAEIELHAGLQFFLQFGRRFALLGMIPTLQSDGRFIDISLARLTDAYALVQCFVDIDASRAAEDNQIKERVSTQTISTMNRHASRLADSEEAWHGLVLALGIPSDRLAMNIGRQPAHHIVTSRYDRDRFFDGVNVSESL